METWHCLLQSWKTSIIGAFLVIIALILWKFDKPAEAAVAFTTGVGFLTAKDCNKL